MDWPAIRAVELDQPSEVIETFSLDNPFGRHRRRTGCSQLADESYQAGESM